MIPAEAVGYCRLINDYDRMIADYDEAKKKAEATIPEEAVAAALARLPMDVLRYIDEDDMRRALEAAAPHMNPARDSNL